MHNCYDDILERIAEPPSWFDDDGVPRYGPFAPSKLGNIYAQEAALAEVSCQGCGATFRVALTNAFAERHLGLGDVIRLRRVEYGDPPNVGCCAGGPTMNSVMHAILEYWSRDYEVALDWVRDPAYEGAVADEPLEPADAVGEVLAALAGMRSGGGGEPSSADGGATTARVACTSRRNRYDVGGRIVAALAVDGRVLVTYPTDYVVVAPAMLKEVVPDHDVGHWKDGRRVTLAAFDRLAKVDLLAYDALVVLAGPRRGDERSETDRAGVEATLAATPFAGRSVELFLPHSRPVLREPHVVVDAGGRRD